MPKRTIARIIRVFVTVIFLAGFFFSLYYLFNHGREDDADYRALGSSVNTD